MIRNYIDGAWVASLGSDAVDVVNPATEELLARCPLGTAADVDAAATAAQRAFAGWRRTPAIDRVQYLFRLKELLERHFDELVQLCTREHGKTLVESRGDVRRGIQMVETACGMPALMMGQSFEDVAAGIDCQAVRQPMGVFAAITPFNFPAMVPCWFWPFAVAAGNTFVLKPSERVPLSQVRICELVAETGLPPGVLNLVHGGREVGEALCQHPVVRGVSFVGSTPVARHVYAIAARHGKRVQALGGAKNFLVVLPDAAHDFTVRTCLESILGCAGQRCLAGSVIVSVGDAWREVEEKAVRYAAEVAVGDGADPRTQMGPVISRQAAERIAGLIQSAVDEGARLLLDGRGAAGRGYFLKPTVLGGVTPGMRIADEEIFGPVVCLGRAPTLADAIAWINASPFGNTASLFTASGGAARQFSYEAAPGMLGLNIGVPAPMAFFSFGGAKDSFFGDVKAHGSGSVQFYTDAKVTVQRWNSKSNVW